MRLKSKVAIITGGSRGIGFATAERFLQEGAVVILAASTQASADRAVERLREKYPDAVVDGISPNLASLEAVQEVFGEINAKYGCIDILVNNAGISDSTPFTDYTEEIFDKVMDLNIKGVFNASLAAVPYMVSRKSGVILSTSSMVSISGQPSGVAYPASKFAVNGLTVSLARELGPKGIRVNAIDGMEAAFSGELPTVIIRNEDRPGIVSEVSQALSRRGANIATMQLYRDRRGGLAVMVLECDNHLSPALVQELSHLDGVEQCTYLNMEGC